MFADFTIDSHHYMLWLSGPNRGEVSLLFNTDLGPEAPIGSFADFLRAYLTDDAALYG
jgi:hypothetical protein